MGAAAAGALGVLGVNAGLGAAGRVATTGIFFTSGRCVPELAATGALAAPGALLGLGALAAPGALLGAGAAAALGELLAKGTDRRGPIAALGGIDSNSLDAKGGAEAETSLRASSGAGGGSLPASASPTPATLETWIT